MRAAPGSVEQSALVPMQLKHKKFILLSRFVFRHSHDKVPRPIQKGQQLPAVETAKGGFARLSDLGYVKFKMLIWSTAFSNAQLTVARSALINNGFANVDLSLVATPETESKRIGWAHSFDENAIPIAHELVMTRQLIGQHLQVIVGGFENTDQSQFISKAQQAINFLRIAFGTPAAYDLVQETNIFTDLSDASALSDTGFATPLFSMNVNCYADAKTIQLEEISPEMSTYLSLAISNENPIIQFTMLWTALEAAISNKGKKREEFFRDELQSLTINKEVYRLFKDVRGPMFKTGIVNNKTIGRDIWSLFIALQLSLWRNCASRLRIIEGYEAFILRPE